MPPGKRVRSLQRWRKVQAVLLRYGFDILIDQEEIKEVRRFLHTKLRLPLGEFEDRSAPERVRLMLQELGPTYVKLGQIMSSRADLLPVAWTQELAKLQDEVPPFPYSQVREIISAELGAPVEALFEFFDKQPIAAASIGQVHRAMLADRRLVVVKVQRPGIEPQVRADMEIMRDLARLIEANTLWGKQYGVVGVVEEFERTLLDELDYTNEGRNADRLRHNMASNPRVRVPFVYWELVSPHVLTLEWIKGVKVNRLDVLDEAGISRVVIAEALIRSIFKQILSDGFFHADPHPGNLFVDLEEETLIYLDLGMMGYLVMDQREELSNLVLAALRRDSRDLARVILNIGTPYKPVRELELRREIDRILDRYMTASLREISFSGILDEIVSMVFEHGIRLPSELTLALKALMQAEEVGRLLNPNIQIVEVARKVAQQILWERVAPRVVLGDTIQSFREAQRMVKVFPRAAERLLHQIENGKLQFELDLPNFQHQMLHLYIIFNRLAAGLIIAGMVIGSAIAMRIAPQNTWVVVPVLGTVGFIVTLVIGSLLVWNIVQDIQRIKRQQRREREEQTLGRR